MTSLLVLVLLAATMSSTAAAQETRPVIPSPQNTERPRFYVTAQELIQSNHRLTVTVGTEVVWSDPHFGRVWFPSGGENPRVERTDQDFAPCFPSPARIAASSRSSRDIAATTCTRWS